MFTTRRSTAGRFTFDATVRNNNKKNNNRNLLEKIRGLQELESSVIWDVRFKIATYKHFKRK